MNQENFLELATSTIQFQINKHGQYSGMTTCEEVVNSLTQYELLELVSRAIDEKFNEET